MTEKKRRGASWDATRVSSPRGLTINLLGGLCTAADIYISLGDLRKPEYSNIVLTQ